MTENEIREPVQKRSIEKKEKIINAGFDLICQKGYYNTNTAEIAKSAGVSTGIIYQYFKDKHDIHNHLISHKSSQLFQNAVKDYQKLPKSIISFEERMIFFVDNIVNQLTENPRLLSFIAKNLSWGFFKNALTTPVKETDVDFRDVYREMLKEAPEKYAQPELMLFMIVELVSSTCYSSILYSEPVEINKLKPYLYASIRGIIHTCEKKES